MTSTCIYEDIEYVHLETQHTTYTTTPGREVPQYVYATVVQTNPWRPPSRHLEVHGLQLSPYPPAISIPQDVQYTGILSPSVYHSTLLRTMSFCAVIHAALCYLQYALHRVLLLIAMVLRLLSIGMYGYVQSRGIQILRCPDPEMSR
jgi:hypothetical protein